MTTKPTDYKAEAERWLVTNLKVYQGSGASGCVDDLAALLERLCGEAREEQKAKDGWLGCGCRSAFVAPTCTMHTRIRPAFFVEDEA